MCNLEKIETLVDVYMRRKDRSVKFICSGTFTKTKLYEIANNYKEEVFIYDYKKKEFKDIKANTTDYKTTLGRRLRQLRNEKEILQYRVAKAMNVAPQSLAFYENGKRSPSIPTLINFSKYYNVSIDYLIGNSELKGVAK